MKVSTTTPNGLQVQIDGADASQILAVIQALDKGATRKSAPRDIDVVVGQPLRKGKSRRLGNKNKIGYTYWTDRDLRILLDSVIEVDREIKEGGKHVGAHRTKKMHLKRALQKLHEGGDVRNRVPRSVGYMLYEVRDWLRNGELSTVAKPKFKKVAREYFEVIAKKNASYLS